MIVVGIVAAQPVTRLGLASVVTAESTWRVGSSTATVAEFIDTIESHSCAVVLVDTTAVDHGSTVLEPLISRGFTVVAWGGDIDAETGAAVSLPADASPVEMRAAIIDAFAARPGADSFCVSQLTTRQLEVLVLVGGGMANKQVAATLDVSISTVKRHMEQLMERTGRRNRAGLAALAADLGQLRPETLSVLNRDQLPVDAN